MVSAVEQAIQALHAAISRKPHSAAVRAHPDWYNAWTSEIEQTANAVRDAVLTPPTHRHRKGGLYRFIGYAKVQTDTPLADYDQVVVYRAEDGSLWVRPTAEFHDGRFKALPE